MTPRAPRAALVLDDSPRRIAAVVALLEQHDGSPVAAVHVVCSSSRAAERMGAALQRTAAQRRPGSSRTGATGLVVVPHHVHVLGGGAARPSRDADCCLAAAAWLFDQVRQIHQQGHVVDAIAGPQGPLRAMLLRGAIETAGTGDDRLFLIRVRPRSRASRGTSPTATLLLVRHVPPPRRDQARGDDGYSDLVRRRVREWRPTDSVEPLVLDVRRRVARVGTEEISLTPDLTFWYAAFALAPGRVFPHRQFGGSLRLAGDGSPLVSDSAQTDEGAVLHEWLRHLRDVFDRVQPQKGDRFGQLLRNACGLTAPQLGSTLSKIAAAFHDALGDAGERYCVRARRGEGYVLDLPPALLTVVLPPARSGHGGPA